MDAQQPDGKSGRPASEQGPGRRWWQTTPPSRGDECRLVPRDGLVCPSCLLGALHFNGLFQLICDTCGRVAEAGVFT